jgi:hypothetical protein
MARYLTMYVYLAATKQTVFTRDLVELEGFSFCFVVLVLVQKSFSETKDSFSEAKAIIVNDSPRST